MVPDQISRSTPRRRVSHAALVCFVIAAISFIASALGFFVNQALTGSLAISGTAAVGLIYLAMGLLNLGHDSDFVEVVVRMKPDSRERVDSPELERGPAAGDHTDPQSIPDGHARLSSESRQ